MGIDFQGQDLIALYQVAAEEIREHKNRQITYTNYGILLQGLILGVFQFSENSLTGGPLVALTILLIALSFATAVIGTCCINSFQSSMREKREILSKLYKEFSDKFNECLGEIPANYTTEQFYKGLFAKPLVTIFWLGFLVVIFVIALSLSG